MFGQFNRPRWNGERHLNSRMGGIEDSIKMTGLLLEVHNIAPGRGNAPGASGALSFLVSPTPLPFRAVLRVTSPVDWLATERD
jgi:hypothetical protein